MAGRVATKRQHERAALGHFGAFDNAAHADQRLVGIWHFDADVRTPGHRRLNAHGRRGQGQRQVIGQADDTIDTHLAPLAGTLGI